MTFGMMIRRAIKYRYTDTYPRNTAALQALAALDKRSLGDLKAICGAFATVSSETTAIFLLRAGLAANLDTR